MYLRKGRKHARAYKVFEEGKETRELIKYLKKGRKHARWEGNTRAYKVFEEGKEHTREEGKETRELISI